MIKAILFDGDDTLYVVKRFVKDIDIQAMAHISKKTGVSAEQLYAEWREIIEKVKKSLNPKIRYRDYSYAELMKKHGMEEAEKYGREEYEFFSKTLISKMKLMPGIKKVLEEAKRNYKTALVTGDKRERVERKLKKFGLDKYFNTIITSTEVGSVKPSAKYCELAAKKLGVSIKECLMVGNSLEEDILPAKKLGIKTIMINSVNSGEGDYNITDCKELLGILKKIN